MALVATVLITVLVAVLTYRMRFIVVRIAVTVSASYVAAYIAYWLPFWLSASDQAASWQWMAINGSFTIAAVIGSLVVLISGIIKRSGSKSHDNYS